MTQARAGNIQESNLAKGKVTEEGWREGHGDVESREWFYVNSDPSTEAEKGGGCVATNRD